MFSFFKKKVFQPNFPIIDLSASPEEVFEVLAAFGEVKAVDSNERDIDLEYACEANGTRISVGFKAKIVSYVNYLTDHFNSSAKQRAEKLNWFLTYYGGLKDFEEPVDTGYMIFFHNPNRNLSVVFGLHKGPIRINNHADNAKR